MNANASIMGLFGGHGGTESLRKAKLCGSETRDEIVCISCDLSLEKGLLLWSEEKMSCESDPNSVGGIVSDAVADFVTLCGD